MVLARKTMNKLLSFQDIVSNLYSYWSNESNCSILHSYDIEVGAGTLSPHTALRVLDSKPWNVCYVQYSRRPTDARYGENPNRLGAYYQMQVILKPAPENIQDLCIKSLASAGINVEKHDIRFVEDDWENPSIGASGLGFEVWCDGMEVIQFTYMQKLGGMDCEVVSAEITYGLERIAMYSQGKNKIYDIVWNRTKNGDIMYSDIHFPEYENEQSKYFFDYNRDNDEIRLFFDRCKIEADNLVSKDLILPAYEYCLKASHSLNILDARGMLSHSERTESILSIRSLVKKCCLSWKSKYGNK